MISCIIPVYQAAGTLPACLDSLLASTCTHYELLAVLNGEDDGSREIAERYAGRDGRVRVLHSPPGQSAARNAGIRAAKGERLCFCDADDTVDPAWMETLLEDLEAYRADLSACSYQEWWYDDRGRVARKQYYHHLREGAVSCGEYLLEMNGPYAAGYAFLPLLWNKLFRTGIVREHGIRFHEGYAFTEDFDFVLRYLAHCDTVALGNRHLYHYHRRNAASVMERYYPDVLDIFGSHVDRCLALAAEKLPGDGGAAVRQPMGSLCVGGMVRLCRADATVPDTEIRERLSGFIGRPQVRRVLNSYRAGPGQSAEIPELALKGDVEALFRCCRERSKARFGP